MRCFRVFKFKQYFFSLRLPLAFSASARECFLQCARFSWFSTQKQHEKRYFLLYFTCYLILNMNIPLLVFQGWRTKGKSCIQGYTTLMTELRTIRRRETTMDNYNPSILPESIELYWIWIHPENSYLYCIILYKVVIQEKTTWCNSVFTNF